MPDSAIGAASAPGRAVVDPAGAEARRERRVIGAVVIGGAIVAASVIVADSPVASSAGSAVRESDSVGTIARAPAADASATVSIVTVSASGAGAPHTTDGCAGAISLERRRSSERELPDVSADAEAGVETERLERRVGAEPAKEGSNDKRRGSQVVVAREATFRTSGF